MRKYVIPLLFFLYGCASTFPPAAPSVSRMETEPAEASSQNILLPSSQVPTETTPEAGVSSSPSETGMLIAPQSNAPEGQPSPTQAVPEVPVRDFIRFAYTFPVSGVQEETLFRLANHIILSGPVDLGRYPLEAALLFQQKGSAVVALENTALSSITPDSRYGASLRRTENNGFLGYEFALDYMHYDALNNFIEPRTLFGIWLVKGALYVSGGASYRRVFPTWDDLTDNSVSYGELRWTLKAAFASPLGHRGAVVCEAFMDGPALDATADQGLRFAWYPSRRFGMAVSASHTTSLLLGRLEDLGGDIVVELGRSLELLLSWTSRKYTDLGDRDDIPSVQLIVRF